MKHIGGLELLHQSFVHLSILPQCYQPSRDKDITASSIAVFVEMLKTTTSFPVLTIFTLFSPKVKHDFLFSRK